MREVAMVRALVWSIVLRIRLRSRIFMRHDLEIEEICCATERFLSKMTPRLRAESSSRIRVKRVRPVDKDLNWTWTCDLWTWTWTWTCNLWTRTRTWPWRFQNQRTWTWRKRTRIWTWTCHHGTWLHLCEWALKVARLNWIKCCPVRCIFCWRKC